jgi:hypothetical protein
MPLEVNGENVRLDFREDCPAWRRELQLADDDLGSMRPLLLTLIKAAKTVHTAGTAFNGAIEGLTQGFDARDASPACVPYERALKRSDAALCEAASSPAYASLLTGATVRATPHDAQCPNQAVLCMRRRLVRTRTMLNSYAASSRRQAPPTRLFSAPSLSECGIVTGARPSRAVRPSCRKTACGHTPIS